MNMESTSLSMAGCAVYISSYMASKGELESALFYLRNTQLYLSKHVQAVNNLSLVNLEVMHQRFLQHLYFLACTPFLKNTENDMSLTRYMKINLNIRFLYKQYSALVDDLSLREHDIVSDIDISFIRNDLNNMTNFFEFDLTKLQHFESELSEIFMLEMQRAANFREKSALGIRHIQMISMIQGLKIHYCAKHGIEAPDTIALASDAISDACANDLFIYSNPMVTGAVSMAASVNLVNLKAEITDKSVVALKSNFKALSTMYNKYEIVRMKFSVILGMMERFLRTYEEMQIVSPKLLLELVEDQEEEKVEISSVVLHAVGYRDT